MSKQLPKITKENLRLLAEGATCKDCVDGHRMYHGAFPKPDDWDDTCITCKGTGLIAPDHRTLDALVAEALGVSWHPTKARHSELVISEYGNLTHYTSPHRAEGWGLLGEADRVDVCWDNGPCMVAIGDDIEFTHDSELVARIGAYLLWKEATR